MVRSFINLINVFSTALSVTVFKDTLETSLNKRNAVMGKGLKLSWIIFTKI